MSVIRPKLPEDPIEYEPGAIVAPRGSAGDRPDAGEGRLDRLRTQMLGDADAARPDLLLDAYNTDGGRAGSQLFAILQAARRIRDSVDRVIVLGDGSGPLGARALFESCAHPRHNELSRGERGGRPRLSFVESCLDNDALQGLLDLVAPAGRPRGGDLLDHWAIVAVDTTGRGPETVAATRLFVAAILDGAEGDPATLADRLVVIARPAGPLARFAAAAGCTSVFAIPDDAGDGAPVFTAAGLLPAAIAGIDVVRLLQGAAAMNRRFREAPSADNPVLRFAGMSELAVEQGGGHRVFSTATSQLDAIGRWYGQLAARHHRGAAPATHLTTHLVSREPRRDPLVVPALPAWAAHTEGLDQLAGIRWPHLPVAGPAADNVPQPAADTILLPRIDEHAIGQLLQMLVLASLVESRF